MFQNMEGYYRKEKNYLRNFFYEKVFFDWKSKLED